jgi:hypothetical protein
MLFNQMQSKPFSRRGAKAIEKAVGNRFESLAGLLRFRMIVG